MIISKKSNKIIIIFSIKSKLLQQKKNFLKDIKESFLVISVFFDTNVINKQIIDNTIIS